MNKYLEDLKKAYSSVPNTYLNQDVIHSLIDIAKIQDIERVFLAELYHQWRVLMESNPTKYKNLVLHSEIGKMLTQKKVQFPDLALHGGQIGEWRVTKNEVYVELKMKKFAKYDIIKCFNALSNHNYNISVCIIHQRDNSFIRKRVINNSGTISNYSNLFDKFYFLTHADSLINLNDLLSGF